VIRSILPSLRQAVSLGSLLALMLVPLVAVAQETTGAVRGEVTDSSSARVAEVRIELTNTETGTVYRQSSNMEGLYTFNLIPPGAYSIRASLPGFQTFTMSGIRVEVNRTTQVNLRLELGSVTEVVEVEATLAAIETATANVNTNVERKYVVDLPSASRNALGMAVMAPGVVLRNADSQVMNTTGASANVNGLRRTANVFYMDGSDNTGTFRNTALQFPNPEAVQEVQVSTASTSAEFGKQPGGIFNIVTRSGTNDLHGAGFFFFRNQNLNANTWDRNRSGAERPIDDQKQIGGVLGGPVIRNKTFFFGSGMVYRRNNPRFMNNRQVPTGALLSGDFSQFNRPLYHPDSGAPLPNNRIPASLLDPVAARLAERLPLVSNLGERLIWDFNEATQNHETLAKVDHNFSDKHQSNVSIMNTWGGSEEFTGLGNEIPTWGPVSVDSRQVTIAGRHVWTLSPNSVAQFRYTASQHIADRNNYAIQGTSLEDLGANFPLGSPNAIKHLPRINISDGFSASFGSISYFKQMNQRFGGTMSLIRGRHNIKFGIESQRSAVRQSLLSDRATFGFDGRSSSRPAVGNPQGIGVFGYAMADFVTGRSSAFSHIGTRDYNILNWSHFLFIQDEWRITPRLTLTPGLRYEFYQPPREIDGRASGFLQGHQSNQYPNAPVGLAFQGDAGVQMGFVRQDWTNFAPRLGIAWDVTGDGRTAIRAGGGLYFSYNSLQLPMWNSERVPWEPSANGGETLSLVNPWTTSRTIVYDRPPTPFSLNPNDFNYPARLVNLIGYDNNWHTPYTGQWTLSIEREIVQGVSVNAGYVANRGMHFWQSLEGNLPLWADNATLQNVEIRRPIPGFGAVDMMHSRTRSWYDSFQFSANTRRYKGLVTRLIYVYGKALAVEPEDRGSGGNLRPANPLNADGEKAEEGNRHTTRGFFVYDFPFVARSNSFLGRVLGNWQLSGTLEMQSRNRINATIGEDWNRDGVAGDRPDVTGPITYTSGTRDERMARFFDTSVFRNPSIRNTFGNLGRNAMWGAGMWRSDAALLKNFPMGESRFLQYRAEFYRVFNNNDLNNPNTNFRSVDFGRILNRSGNRTMQMGLRYVF
jgi:outer membrane receptor protein involved in Fe transport